MGIDNRSFGINDEINVAIVNTDVAARLSQSFEEDRSHSKRVTLQDWENRSAAERLLEGVGWIVERQQ